MDPTSSEWVAVDIQPLDLLALDVIGWDVVDVPEPATAALLLSGLWLLLWRRQN